MSAFVEQYETVRQKEGRRVTDPRRLPGLPYRALSRARAYEWSIRAQSYRALIRRVMGPLEKMAPRPVKVLDLGSGLGWLAYRLTVRGHEVAGVDVVVNDFDGLGVHRHYDRALLAVQAEFDRLPFRQGSVDVVIYNASFHYSSSYRRTLEEALRVLTGAGRLVIMDSPIYSDASSGRTMVRERDEVFERQYGLRGNLVRTEGFLTYDRLGALGADLALRFELFEPWRGIRWWLKPWSARLLGRREPARFQIVVGRRAEPPPG